MSDLHLGEDVKPFKRPQGIDHMGLLERSLESFLAYYGRTRLDGRPWRLIVNGDMIDFLNVCLLPGENPAGDEEPHSPEEHRFGLGSGPRAARRKILRVCQRHPGVFQRLAELVRAGNDVVIVHGNHDVELHWSIVQAAFKDHLARLALGPRAAAEGGAAVDAFRERITFMPWFYYEEGICYVEHGHQYDEYCSFDYLLCPIAPRAHEGLLLSLGSASIRYVSNIIPDLDPFEQEEWNLAGYARWAFGRGLRTLLRILYLYAFTVWKLMAVWGQLRELAVERSRRRQHEARLAEVARSANLPEATVRELDALRRRPVIKNFWKLVMAVFLDRVALATVALVGLVIASVEARGAWKLAWALGLLGATALGNELLARFRNLDSDSQLRQVPGRIRRHLKVPYIVFGHSHAPCAVPLAGGGTYFNTGTWVAGLRPGVLRAFTHVLIRRDAGGAPHATLCQWRDGESRQFEQTVA